MKHLTTRLLGLVAATLVATTPPAIASIEQAGETSTESFTDAHGDSDAGSDIFRVKVVNGSPVRIVIRHDDLVKSYRSQAGISVFIDSNRRHRGPDRVFLGGLFEGTDYGLLHARGWKRKNDPVISCHHRMRLDYDKDVTRIRMARACLADGVGKIRVAVRTAGKTADGTTDRDWLTGHRTWTPWVARG